MILPIIFHLIVMPVQAAALLKHDCTIYHQYHGLEIKGRQPESVISRLSPRKFLSLYTGFSQVSLYIMSTFVVKLNDAVR